MGLRFAAVQSRPSTDVLLRWADRAAIWLVLLALLSVGALLSEAFLSPTYLFNVVRQAAPVGIAALGVTLVMILGGVDLSVGAIISLTAVLAATLMDGQVANLPHALLLTCLTGLVIGVLNGLIVAGSGASPFIVTLGMAIAVYGATILISGGTARGIVSPGFREFLNLRAGGMVPMLAIVFIALTLLVGLLQSVTTFGRQLYLIGANPRAATLSGLAVARTMIAAYATSGLFAALAGIALLARTGVSSTYAGRGYEFDVLAAVVLGGTTFEGGRGGIGGTLAGVFVLLLAFNLVNILGLSLHAQLMLKGMIIIIASAAYAALRRYGGNR